MSFENWVFYDPYLPFFCSFVFFSVLLCSFLFFCALFFSFLFFSFLFSLFFFFSLFFSFLSSFLYFFYSICFFGVFFTRFFVVGYVYVFFLYLFIVFLLFFFVFFFECVCVCFGFLLFLSFFLSIFIHYNLCPVLHPVKFAACHFCVIVIFDLCHFQDPYGKLLCFGDLDGICGRFYIFQGRWSEVLSRFFYISGIFCVFLPTNAFLYRFSASWLRSKCSICSYQLNIWYVAYMVTSILNWFLDTGEMPRACSALATGRPGIAVLPGMAQSLI